MLFRRIICLIFWVGAMYMPAYAQDCKATLSNIVDKMVASIKPSQLYYVKYVTTNVYRDSIHSPTQKTSCEVSSSASILNIKTEEYEFWEDKEIGVTLLKQKKIAVLSDSRFELNQKKFVDSALRGNVEMIRSLELINCTKKGDEQVLVLKPNTQKYPKLANLKQVVYIWSVASQQLKSVEIRYVSGIYARVRFEIQKIDYNYTSGISPSLSNKSRFFDANMRLKGTYAGYELRDGRKKK